MSVAKGFHMSDGSVGNLDWNYVTDPDGSKSIIEEVDEVKSDLNDYFVIGKNLFHGDFENAKINSSGVYTTVDVNPTRNTACVRMKFHTASLKITIGSFLKTQAVHFRLSLPAVNVQKQI